jgi:hypothetical protein
MHCSLRNEMLDAYRGLPVYYLKPLRAVLRKASAAAPVQLTVPEFREQSAEDAAAASTKASSGASLPLLALPPAVKAHLHQLKMDKAKLYETCGAAPPPSFPAPPASVDEALEGEARDVSRLARRLRGGTPALFRSLGGDQGNYGSVDFKNSKAALAVNPFNIPRGNLLVHLRRMRLALLGHDKAARVDKRQDSRHDRTTHSVPIADMGKFQDVPMRRAAHGASSAPPLRDPLADADEVNRRNRSQFGNPFRKGDKGLAIASDEIDGEAEAATGVNKQRAAERRRRRQPFGGSRRSSALGSGAKAGAAGGGGPESLSDGADFSPSRSPSPSPSPSPHSSPAPSRNQSPAFGLDQAASGARGPDAIAEAGRQLSVHAAGSRHGKVEEVTVSNRCQIKLSMMRQVRQRGGKASAVLHRAKGLRGDALVIKGLLAQVADFAQEWRNKDLALKLLALCQ